MTQYVREQPRAYYQQMQGYPTGYYQQPQQQPIGHYQQGQQQQRGYFQPTQEQLRVYYQHSQAQPSAYYQQVQGQATGYSQPKQEQSTDYRQQVQQQPRGYHQQTQGPVHQYPPSNTVLGLQFLAPFSTLSFSQEASVLQTVTGLSAAQKFNVYNEYRQLIMRATENSDELCHRMCCAGKRAFLIQVTNLQGQEIIRISREFKWCVGCCWCASADCCAFEALIETSNHDVIGRIRQKCSFIRNHYTLMDAAGNEHLEAVSPYCICQGVFCCCCENKFTLFTADSNEEIGAIFKEYAGVVHQAVTGAEKYTIKFPVDLPSEIKAVALGALFLINFVHFGGNAKKKGGTDLLSMVT